jgi:TRAP transporter 4TM/12TM fusion protein
MSDSQAETPDFLGRSALVLGFILVLMGMANNLPNIPGLLELVQSIPGLSGLPRLSKYDPEYFYPLTFFFMLLVSLLGASLAKQGFAKSKAQGFLGLGSDILMVVITILVSAVYLIEHDQVCLIDQLSGERARLIAEDTTRVAEYMEAFGTVLEQELPDCQVTTGTWILPLLLISIAIYFLYIIKVWGFPIVAVALFVAGYTVVTSAVWYFDWSDHAYFTTAIGTIEGGVRNAKGGIEAARTALIADSNGLLGQFLGITVNVVFPYVVLGSLFGASAGGQALIKFAIIATRKLRGGPAHAAIVGSATFGTISGGPVVNVLGTGTLTIPMMMKSGFRPTFAGGVEAAASTGGQIMPPVMGIAAFVLAALSSVPYSEVIVAAFIPALAYFFSLFLMVVFESRRIGMQPVGKLSEEQKLTKKEKINLLMIVGPIVLILVLLLTKKDTVGHGILGWLMGYTPGSGDALPWFLPVYQNAAGDPDSTGFWAVILLICLMFLDPEIRQKPGKILHALAEAGTFISQLFLLLIAIAVIDICINFTNFTGILTIDILNWLKTADNFMLFGQEFQLDGAVYLMLALVIAMVATIMLGMGMPTLPAYVNVVLIIGPLLAALGTSFFTAHMFVFYFAVASAITPPVAIAAFAASTISKADPLATGFAAVRCGIVVFTIPFVFAFYPELLLIEPAQVAQSLEGASAGKTYLPGYDGTVALGPLLWLILKLIISLYLVASALMKFDAANISVIEILLRLLLAVLILMKAPEISSVALGLAIVLLAFHQFRNWAGRSRKVPEN